VKDLAMRARSVGFRGIAILTLALVLPGVGPRSDLVAQATTLRFAVAPEGNEARYRVREQLAGLSFPNDAVGVTAAVTGEIVVDVATGRVQANASRIVVELAGLTSDQSRRDNYVRNRTLETEQHPTAVLVPTELRGLPWPLPATGTVTFQLIGNLTVKQVTRSTTWDVTLDLAGTTMTGTATTSFTFEDFAMTKPRVASVLSVDDTIRLEYDLRLIRP
jgi:polyisoprenoid-binding protein YceI